MHATEMLKSNTTPKLLEPIRSEEVVEVVTDYYSVWTKDLNNYGVIIRTNTRLMYAMNRLTDRYCVTTKFQTFEEPLFIVPKHERAQLMQTLELNWMAI